MSIIIPANSAVSGGFGVANSLMLDGSSAFLTRDPSSNGNQKTWTWSAWVKKATVGMGNGDYQMLFTGNIGNGSRYTDISFREDYLEVFGGVYSTSTTTVSINVSTNKKFNDPAAWYHLVVAIDTTQGTDSNRVKIYVNGVQETSLKNYQGSTVVYPSQNADTFMNVTTAQNRIGASGGSYYFNGYIAENVFIDGTALSPTSFGEFDEDSGIWKPIDVSGLTFGTDGFYLDFEDSSALGDDAANSNNFTVNNIAATDQATDTCTNNFSVLNPLDNPYPAQPATFSQGNLIGQSTESGFLSGASTIGVSTGKWYAEFKLTAGNMGLSTMGVITDPVDNLGTTAPHDSTKFYGVRGNGDKYQPGGTQTTSWAGSWSTNDIISLALDVDNNYLYVAKNGQYADGSGNYDEAFTGSPAAITIASGQTYFFTGGSISTGTGVFLTMASNFGFPSFAITSGNTDGSGYGNFEYTVPSGYFSLNTKNLAEYG
tara:strand:- start:107 stop:1561 length:1455 start_codon:yes stop_codon:yes gene_type:complete